MQFESHHPETLPAAAPVESLGDRLRRHGRQTGLYTWAVGLVALLVVLIALVGWLLGILTSEVFRLAHTARATVVGHLGFVHG